MEKERLIPYWNGVRHHINKEHLAFTTIHISRNDVLKVNSIVQNGFFKSRDEFIRFSLYQMLFDNIGINIDIRRPLDKVPFRYPHKLYNTIELIYPGFNFSEICRTAISYFLKKIGEVLI